MGNCPLCAMLRNLPIHVPGARKTGQSKAATQGSDNMGQQVDLWATEPFLRFFSRSHFGGQFKERPGHGCLMFGSRCGQKAHPPETRRLKRFQGAPGSQQGVVQNVHAIGASQGLQSTYSAHAEKFKGIGVLSGEIDGPGR